MQISAKCRGCANFIDEHKLASNAKYIPHCQRGRVEFPTGCDIDYIAWSEYYKEVIEHDRQE